MFESILGAGLRGAAEGLLIASIILIPLYLKNKVVFWRDLSRSVLSEPNENTPYIKYKGKTYSYTNLIYYRTLSHFKRSDKALEKDCWKFFEAKKKTEIIEIECFAANAALILKERHMPYEKYARISSEWIVSNRDILSSATDPIVAFDELSSLDFKEHVDSSKNIKDSKDHSVNYEIIIGIALIVFVLGSILYMHSVGKI